jgi:predicted ester cyclase
VTDGETLRGYPARYFAAWHGGDAGAFDELLAPSFTWSDPSLPAALTDAGGVHSFFDASTTSFPDLHFEVLGEVLVDVEGGRVAALWRMTGTHQAEALPPQVAATGNSIDVIGADVFTLASDGRATEIRACYDAMTMAGQLGLLG